MVWLPRGKLTPKILYKPGPELSRKVASFTPGHFHISPSLLAVCIQIASSLPTGFGALVASNLPPVYRQKHLFWRKTDTKGAANMSQWDCGGRPVAIFAFWHRKYEFLRSRAVPGFGGLSYPPGTFGTGKAQYRNESWFEPSLYVHAQIVHKKSQKTAALYSYRKAHCAPIKGSWKKSPGSGESTAQQQVPCSPWS